MIKSIYQLIASKLRQSDSTILEQLLDTRTLGDAFITPLKLRLVNWAAIILLFLWAFSPLGSQASLRIVTEYDTTEINQSLRVVYLDFNSPYHMFTGSQTRDKDIDVVNAIYTASLIGPVDTKQNSEDSWNNLKIPAIDYDVKDSNFSQCKNPYNTTTDLPDSDTFYSSLVGIPIIGNLTSPGEAYGVGTDNPDNEPYDEFKMTTMYMYVSCGELNSSNIARVNTTAHNPDLRTFKSRTGLSITTDNNRSGSKSSARQIYLEMFSAGKIGKTLVATTCNLTSTYLIVNATYQSTLDVSCVQRSDQGNSSTTPLDNAGVSESFFADFVNATVPEDNATVASATEWYLATPNDPFDTANNDSYPDFSNVTASLLSLRLTQLINSYYLASIAPVGITNSSQQEKDAHYIPIQASPEDPYSIIICHKEWLVILIVAASIMMLSGLTCLFLGIYHPYPIGYSHPGLDRAAHRLRDDSSQRSSSPAGGMDFLN